MNSSKPIRAAASVAGRELTEPHAHRELGTPVESRTACHALVAQRTFSKKAFTSSTKSSGCSNAAKRPPRGSVVQCVMLYPVSHHRRVSVSQYSVVTSYNTKVAGPGRPRSSMASCSGWSVPGSATARRSSCCEDVGTLRRGGRRGPVPCWAASNHGDLKGCKVTSEARCWEQGPMMSSHIR